VVNVIIYHFIKKIMKSNTQKIAVIGGSGKAGKYLVQQLVYEGHSVRALVRDPARFQVNNPAIEMVIGDVTRYENIKTLITGCDAAISTLGLGVPPSMPTVFSIATRNILEALKESILNRYLAITGLNVDTPSDRKGPITKYATEWMYTHYPKSTADRQLEYDLLVASNIDWTLVRLPLIDQTDVDHSLSESLEDCPGDKVSATSLARFLVRQLNNTTYIRKAPFVANA
jgi:putative NADH-flavin reductase